MKKHLHILLPFIVLIFNGCKKEGGNNNVIQGGPGLITLLTLNITPDAVRYAQSGSNYFVITDESGKILTEVKYVKGTSTFTMSTLASYQKDRFNFFEIDVPADLTTPSVIGFLQVKKGSVYTTNVPFLPQKQSSPIKLHLQNSTGFSQLNISTDIASSSINLLSDSTLLQGLPYSAGGSKLWVQMLKNNQYSYKFFDIPTGTSNYNVDLTQLNEIPLVQTISSPGNNIGVEVFAKADVNYSSSYYFGLIYSPYSNTLKYYYPSEIFPEYDVEMGYTVGNLDYLIITAGKTIPNQVPAFNASFNIPSSTLANFVPSYSGTFDYYHAHFLNVNSSPKLQVDLFSPSAANYTNIMLPDFSKYLGVTNVDLNTLALDTFELYQCDGFNEQNFFYPNFHSQFNINSKTVYRSY